MKSNSGHQMKTRLVIQESQIDHSVYQIYDLTPEEIAIVEGPK